VAPGPPARSPWSRSPWSRSPWSRSPGPRPWSPGPRWFRWKWSPTRPVVTANLVRAPRSLCSASTSIAMLARARVVVRPKATGHVAPW